MSFVRLPFPSHTHARFKTLSKTLSYIHVFGVALCACSLLATAGEAEGRGEEGRKESKSIVLYPE